MKTTFYKNIISRLYYEIVAILALCVCERERERERERVGAAKDFHRIFREPYFFTLLLWGWYKADLKHLIIFVPPSFWYDARFRY